MPPWMTSSALLDEGLARRRILHSNLDYRRCERFLEAPPELSKPATLV